MPRHQDQPRWRPSRSSPLTTFVFAGLVRAGLQAVTIVWIAASFTDEHRAALDWLNQVTDEDVWFFGLEIELWRIGASPAAPKFNVVIVVLTTGDR
jgi:hypothetical protein